MANIIIYQLHNPESHSYLIEITDIYSLPVYGGHIYGMESAFNKMLNLTDKLLNFMLTTFAIYSIVSLAQSFITVNQCSCSPQLLVPY
jgi:hypothetical protein